MDNIILQLKNIHKHFVDGTNTRVNLEVLRNINLEICRGELVSIIGASGSGKSTLLHICGLLEKPNSGDVFIDSVNSTSLSETETNRTRLQKIGFVYQYHHLLHDFTAQENVALPMVLNGHNWNNSMQSAIELLSNFGISKRAKHIPSELSGGERQRVAIARAMINRPQILLADEPTGNLDPHNAKEVLKNFIDLVRGYNTSVLMVTHNHELTLHSKKIFNIISGEIKALEA